jgi:HEAT repeat protein
MSSAASLGVLLSKMGAAPEIRIQVAEGLGRHSGEAAWPALMALLADPMLRVRRAAIMGLAYSRQPEGVDLLQQFTRHPNPRIRQAAAWALCRHPGRNTITLVRLLRRIHPEPWPKTPWSEVVHKRHKPEAQRAAEFPVRYVHLQVGLP